jgi:hypothetical protein
LEAQAAGFDHYVAPFRLTDSGPGANGFMFVGGGNEGDFEGFGHRFKVNTYIFI